jgi:flavodoxin
MEPLVVFYSRTGTTKTAAETIAKQLDCPSEEIIDTKKRTGLFGFIFAGRDAMRARLTTIKKTREDPKDRKAVVLCTPIWGGAITPAIRTYIKQNRKKFKSVAFLTTSGGKNTGHAVDQLEEACGKKPVAVLSVTNKDIKDGAVSKKLRSFSGKIKQTPEK